MVREPLWPVAARPVVFLDIDGVLNRHMHAKFIALEEECVANFKRLVEAADAQIVLSTFWRNFDSYIAYILHRHGIDASRVVGITPGVGDAKAAALGRRSEDASEYTVVKRFASAFEVSEELLDELRGAVSVQHSITKSNLTRKTMMMPGPGTLARSPSAVLLASSDFNVVLESLCHR